MKTYRKERYEWLKSKGYCVRCGKEKAEPGKTACTLCKMNAREKNRIYWHEKCSPEQKQKYYEKAKMYRQMLDDEGICKKCSKRPAKDGRKMCANCLAQERERMKTARIAKGVMPRCIMGNGKYCYFCGKSGCNGEKLCPECKAAATSHLPKPQSQTSDHIWRKMSGIDVEECRIKRELREKNND